MTPRNVDREGKKSQILEAAFSVFALRGIGAATISDIAKEAGIGKGTVYEYFDSKESLVNELMEYFFSLFDSLVLDLPPVKGCDRETFLQLLSGVISTPPELERGFPVFFEAIAMAGRGELSGVVERMAEWFDGLARFFVPYIEELQKKGEIDKKADPFILIRSLFAFLDGAMLHMHLFINQSGAIKASDWEGEARRLMETYLFCPPSPRKKR